MSDSRAPAAMLSDFGGSFCGDPAETYPIHSLEALRAAVRHCSERGKAMRARCFAHSMNGMSVPRQDEALLDMTGVRHVAWKGEGRIVAGAGLSVWELDDYVRGFGWKLPVVNDGGAEAPSVGGFIAAGGIGAQSVFHGGFWESVSDISLVTMDGAVRTVANDDPIFPWLFGSMGMFGVTYEASLVLVPAGRSDGTKVTSAASLPKSGAACWPPHLWLTLFVAQDRRDDAIDRLNALVLAHPFAWHPRQSYEYYLPYRRFHPPLLFDGVADIAAVGIWGDRAEEDRELSAYFALEEEFQRMAEHFGFRRYFQTELIREARGLERYVGRKCAAKCRALKQLLDPGNLLNVFAEEGVPPVHRQARQLRLTNRQAPPNG